VCKNDKTRAKNSAEHETCRYVLLKFPKLNFNKVRSAALSLSNTGRGAVERKLWR